MKQKWEQKVKVDLNGTRTKHSQKKREREQKKLRNRKRTGPKKALKHEKFKNHREQKGNGKTHIPFQKVKKLSSHMGLLFTNK